MSLTEMTTTHPTYSVCDNSDEMYDDAAISDRLMNIHIDNLWRGLGKFGRFQTTQLVFLLLSCASGWNKFSILFIGYVPNFACIKSENSTDLWDNYYDGNDTTTHSQCLITKTLSNGSYVETDCGFGYNYSVQKGCSIVSEWDLVCDKDSYSGFTQSMLVMGQAVGGLASGIADKIGRRPTHIVSHGLLFAVLCGTALAPNYWTFVVLRFWTGLLMTISDSATWTAMIEVIPNEHRAAYGGISGIVATLTSILPIPVAYALQTYSWRVNQFLFASSALHFIFSIFIMEESLCWLIATRRKDAAVKLFKKACALNGVCLSYIMTSDKSSENRHENETNECCHEDQVKVNMKESQLPAPYHNKPTEENDTNECNHKNQTGENAKYSQLSTSYPDEPTGIQDTSNNCESKDFSEHENGGTQSNDTVLMFVKSRILLQQTVIVSFSWFAHILIFHGLFLTSSIISDDRYLQFVLSNLVEIPACLFSWYTMYRFGRRSTCRWGLLIAGVTLLSTTILSQFEGISEALGILKPVLVMIGKFGISLSYNALIIYLPELFPTNLRNTGLGITEFWSRTAGTLVPYSDNLAHIARWIPELIFASTSLSTAWVMGFLPETKGRELPRNVKELENWRRQKQDSETKKNNRNDTPQDADSINVDCSSL